MKHTEKAKVIFMLLLLSMGLTSNAQLKPNEPTRVAIFLYEGVELLDFAGPGEVFSAAGFKTYTVSVDGNEVVSQGFVNIKPKYSIDNVPAPDIIIFPGGASEASSKDPRVLDWIKKLSGQGSSFMSVCTGAFILAKAGLLDNKRVTTHWGSTKGLAKSLPSSTVLENTRFVDNGAVITTAGVSAGIDGALHFVSRLKGLDAAKQTARYMEYDKWNPDYGVVDKNNEYLQTLVQAKGVENKVASPKADLTAANQSPYVGEFKNLATELEAKGENAKAATVLEAGIKIYPNSGSLYSELSNVYTKLGKPSPITESQFIGLIKEGKIDDAVARYEKDKKAFPGWKIYTEEELNNAGYYFIYQKNDPETAIRVFQLNVKEFPQSGNAYDSLAEAYLKAGKKQDAIANYKKSLALDETNENARKVLKQIDTK